MDLNRKDRPFMDEANTGDNIKCLDAETKPQGMFAFNRMMKKLSFIRDKKTRKPHNSSEASTRRTDSSEIENNNDLDTGDELQHGWQPLEGMLSKYTNVMKGWQYRWCVLDPEGGRLEYYEKQEHKKLQKARGCIFLSAAVICPSDEDSMTFNINAANGEIYRFRAENAKERQHWVNRLRATSEFHTNTLAPNGTHIGSSNPSVLPQNRPQSLNPTKTNSHPSESVTGNHENFASSSAGNLPTSVPRTKLQGKTPPPPRPPPPQLPVSVQVNDSLKSVKDMMSEVKTNSGNLSSQIESLPSSGEYISSLDKEMLLLKATSNATLACLEQCFSILSQVRDQPPQEAEKPVEWISAEPDIHEAAAVQEKLPESPVMSISESFTSVFSEPTMLDGHESVPINHDEEIEDEKEYSDTDLDGIEEHKSIILHLLSQLKLGMDLTKVVLPTFILERRSLLEMFADCMAHPDLFLKIPSFSTPEDRMLAVFEWYITSFHAGRKGDIAKKPYNPIIGETFYCSWKVPTEASSEETPHSTTNLYFSAEQVSHHPPISAFYFESPEKAMSMNGSIWTKSKFMGMSIGVVMVGKLTLNLLEYGEEYTFTLPSAYARSILTVPWVELGDKVTLNCAKTGFTSSIVFHTKPFYGGKLHRISGEVKNPANEIIMKASGEWNGQIELIRNTGASKTIDTNKLNTMRKFVRPLQKQGPFESRNLWRHVTASLEKGNVNEATQHKHNLEEQQRRGERYRKETNTRFPTQNFQELAQGVWMYKEPLKQGQIETSIV